MSSFTNFKYIVLIIMQLLSIYITESMSQSIHLDIIWKGNQSVNKVYF